MSGDVIRFAVIGIIIGLVFAVAIQGTTLIYLFVKKKNFTN